MKDRASSEVFRQGKVLRWFRGNTARTEAPNPKHQAPKKLHSSSSKPRSERCGDLHGGALRFGAWNFSGTWCLGFGASRRSDSIENSGEPKEMLQRCRIRALQRMKGKFDFACPLVIGAFLAGDLDRASLGLRGVDEVHAQGRQVPVLEGEFVRALSRASRASRRIRSE